MKLAALTLTLWTLLSPGISLPAWGQEEVLPIQKKIYQGYQLLDDWRVAEADTHIQTLLGEHPELGDVHFLHARVEFLKGRYEQAWNILQQVDDRTRPVKDFKSLVNETRQAASKFISRESEHFIFRFIDGPDQILVHYATEVLERSYEVLGNLFDYHPQQKVLVEFYPDRNSFSRVSPLTLQDIVTSGTVALCKYNRVMMISPSSLLRGFNWMDTLSHEYIHYLLTSKSRNHLPLWIHEGIAKYFESHWREGDDHLTPIMETVLAGGLENDYLIPLESMMPSLAKLKTAEDVQLAYAEVSTMVDYLISLLGEKVIAALLEDLAQGLPFETAFENQTGKDLFAFQQGWKAFVKQKELTRIPGLKAMLPQFKNTQSPAKGKKEYSEIDTQRAQDLTFLADILKSRNHIQAAILEYQKALRESQMHSPVLHNKLAGAYLLTRQYDEAETLLKENLRYYPQFTTTLTNLGETYYQMNRFELAREYYEQAVRTNPFNPFVHQRLIGLYDRLGLKEEKQLQTRLYRFIE